MLQRIQTLYLLIAIIFSVLGIFLLEENPDKIYLLVGYIVSCVLGLITVFTFKNRKLQQRLSLLNVGINVSLLGYMGFNLLKTPGALAENGVQFLFPLGAVVMLLFAIRHINKDEKLVKSVDRIR